MPTSVKEDLMDQTLHWMVDNLDGAYNAVYPENHPKANKYCTNSGTCIIVCCYINALGKVLCRGGPAEKRGREFRRFSKFLQACMPDFLKESLSKSFPNTPNGHNGGENWLYEVYRCGFIHSFYAGESGWTREPHRQEYWLKVMPEVVLNVDELVRGFKLGLEKFRQIANNEPELRSNFHDYLLKK